MNIKKDPVENMFQRLEGTFDLEEPTSGHEIRFMEKLNFPTQRKPRNWWKLISIAASIALLLSIGSRIFYHNITAKSVDIPSEIETTQFYFASLLQKEIEKVNALHTPNTAQIISDAMVQLRKLEEDYQKLENDLIQNGDNRQIVYAMITNFQTRINLLQEVIQQIDALKNFKNNNDESIII